MSGIASGQEQPERSKWKLRKRSVALQSRSGEEEIEDRPSEERPTSKHSTGSENSTEGSEPNIGSQRAKEDLARLSIANFEDGFVVNMPTLRPDDPIPCLLTHEEISKYQATVHRRLSTRNTKAPGSSVRAALQTYSKQRKKPEKTIIPPQAQETDSQPISYTPSMPQREAVKEPVVPYFKPIVRRPVGAPPSPRVGSSSMGAVAAATRAMQNRPKAQWPSNTGSEWETLPPHLASSGKYGILRKLFSKTSPKTLPPQALRPLDTLDNARIPSVSNNGQPPPGTSTALNTIPPRIPNPLHKICIQHPPPAPNLHITDSTNNTLCVHSNLLGPNSMMSLGPNPNQDRDFRASVAESQESDGSWHSDELGGWVEVTPDISRVPSPRIEEISGSRSELRPRKITHRARAVEIVSIGSGSQTLVTDGGSVEYYDPDEGNRSDGNDSTEYEHSSSSSSSEHTHHHSHSPRNNSHYLSGPTRFKRPYHHHHHTLSPSPPPRHPPIGFWNGIRVILQWIVLAIWATIYTTIVSSANLVIHQYKSDRCQKFLYESLPEFIQDFLHQRMQEVKEGSKGEGMKRAAGLILGMVGFVWLARRGWIGWVWGLGWWIVKVWFRKVLNSGLN
ncbi:MAG: hypothetical protein MMC33_003226 [Icmadophila ericetorum]|nr:hypothetical protein [Icmadophila ericetorum]